MTREQGLINFKGCLTPTGVRSIRLRPRQSCRCTRYHGAPRKAICTIHHVREQTWRCFTLLLPIFSQRKDHKWYIRAIHAYRLRLNYVETNPHCRFYAFFFLQAHWAHLEKPSLWCCMALPAVQYTSTWIFESAPSPSIENFLADSIIHKSNVVVGQFRFCKQSPSSCCDQSCL